MMLKIIQDSVGKIQSISIENDQYQRSKSNS